MTLKQISIYLNIFLHEFFETNYSKFLTWKFHNLLDCLKKHAEEDSPSEFECYVIKIAFLWNILYQENCFYRPYPEPAKSNSLLQSSVSTIQRNIFLLSR